MAERTSPQLTSVAIQAEDMGRRAVEMLTRRLADGAASEVVLLPPRLTIRGSTGPGPGQLSLAGLVSSADGGDERPDDLDRPLGQTTSAGSATR